ncbi:MAG: hypothetical protein PHT49_05475 [Desulfovibrionales bacterium]|nr:hypothetical protein [Desulfovibrionales bacterium]
MPRKTYREKQVIGADYRQITWSLKEMGKCFSLCEEKLFLGRREIYYHLGGRRQNAEDRKQNVGRSFYSDFWLLNSIFSYYPLNAKR